MEMGGLMGGLYRICEWIMRLAYVNILWILFTLVGLGVVGIMPSTAAMFAVTRKWIRGETDIPVFATFWSSYKSEFVKVNLLGLIMGAAAVILYLDFRIFQYSTNDLMQMFSFVFFAVLILFSLTVIYMFPVFAHFDIKLLQYIKYSFLIAIGSPMSTIMMVIGLVVIFFLMMKFPGLIVFFSGSLVAFVMMFWANRAFLKIEEKHQKMQEQE